MLSFIALLLVTGLNCGYCSPFQSQRIFKAKYDHVQKTQGTMDLPQTEADAKKDQWTQTNSQCEEASQIYKGKLYKHASHPNTGILFDKAGVFAGVVVMIEESVVTALGSKSYAAFYNNAAFRNITENNNNYKAAIVYFKDPATICTATSQKKDFEIKMFVQIGDDTTDKANLKAVPQVYCDTETDDYKDWVKGGCFLTAGAYFRTDKDRKSDDDASNFSPVSAMLDKQIIGGAISGVSIALMGDISKDPLFQQATSPVAIEALTGKPIPDFANDALIRTGEPEEDAKGANSLAYNLALYLRTFPDPNCPKPPAPATAPVPAPPTTAKPATPAKPASSSGGGGGGPGGPSGPSGPSGSGRK